MKFYLYTYTYTYAYIFYRCYTTRALFYMVSNYCTQLRCLTTNVSYFSFSSYQKKKKQTVAWKRAWKFPQHVP